MSDAINPNIDIDRVKGKQKSKSEAKRSAMSLILGETETLTTVSHEPMLVDIDELVPYSNHPFKLYEGERLSDMVRSIKELGILLPIIIRPLEDDGNYEILSGHNRVNAAKIAGLTEVPVIIKKNLTDDEAKLIVTESNLVQRSFGDLSHSERAVALEMHLSALKDFNGGQGKRTDLLNEVEMLSNPDKINENSTSALIGQKLFSVEKTAKQYGLSKNSVARYVRLTFLNQPLLNRVDNDEIGLYPAVSLSYISPQEQTELENILSTTAYKMDMKKAETLRSFSESKKLTTENMIAVLSGEIDKKPKSKPTTPPPLKIKHKIYSKYFDDSIKQNEMEVIIDTALSEYFARNPNKEDTHED